MQYGGTEFAASSAEVVEDDDTDPDSYILD